LKISIVNSTSHHVHYYDNILVLSQFFETKTLLIPTYFVIKSQLTYRGGDCYSNYFFAIDLQLFAGIFKLIEQCGGCGQRHVHIIYKSAFAVIYYSVN